MHSTIYSYITLFLVTPSNLSCTFALPHSDFNARVASVDQPAPRAIFFLVASREYGALLWMHFRPHELSYHQLTSVRVQYMKLVSLNASCLVK